MKLYTENNPTPNPRKVRIYLAEKGIEVPLSRIQMRKGEHKSPEFLAKNSLGQVPVLELDDGTCICESIAICRYFEEKHPEPPLFGVDALDKAMVEMWVRRVEARVWRPVSMVWRHADERTAFLGGQFKEFGAASREDAFSEMRWLNGEIKDGREFIAGCHYSIADIVTLCGLDFAAFIKLPIPEDCAALLAWHARVCARPSSKA
jgi:glutathione S-transferase